MGDRFYTQQQNKRKRPMPWTDESKAEAVESYTDANPTPETSMEIVKQIADDLGESPNGKQHRMRWLQPSLIRVRK